MNVVLGSTSVDKQQLLEQFLKQKVVGVKANSEIDHQPLSEKETRDRAINRAKNALKIKPKSDLAVVMECGLEKINGVYHLVCVVAVLDGKTGKLKIGANQKRPLPKIVSQQVEGGKEFGNVIREFESKNKAKEDEELINREKSFLEALQQAFNDQTPLAKRESETNGTDSGN